MASSGHRISNGNVSFKQVYRTMVEAEMERPAEAEVQAYSSREGSTMRVWVRVVNRSNVTLEARSNQPSIHALVWENRKLGVTSRLLRAAPHASVQGPVAPGEPCDAVLTTPALSGVDWSRLDTVALVDYRPGGIIGPYDMLQAARARPAGLYLEPSLISLGGEGGATVATVELSGPHTLQWTASSDVPWLLVTPGQGAVPGQASLELVTAALPAGMHEGHATFSATSADGLTFNGTVTVTAELPTPRMRLRRRLHSVQGAQASVKPAAPALPPGR